MFKLKKARLVDNCVWFNNRVHDFDAVPRCHGPIPASKAQGKQIEAMWTELKQLWSSQAQLKPSEVEPWQQTTQTTSVLTLKSTTFECGTAEGHSYHDRDHCKALLKYRKIKKDTKLFQLAWRGSNPSLPFVVKWMGWQAETPGQHREATAGKWENAQMVGYVWAYMIIAVVWSQPGLICGSRQRADMSNPIYQGWGWDLRPLPWGPDVSS